MSIDFRTSIVYILNANAIDDVGERTVGTGFVVSDDGLIATCAHVVDLSDSDEFIHLIFYSRDTIKEDRAIRKARILQEYSRSADAEDIAILRLEGPLPEGIEPLPLGGSYNTQEQTFQSFGFPAAKAEDGLLGECNVLGTVYEDAIPLLQIDSKQISKGFSGAPVWDNRVGHVIGMVTSIIGTKLVKIMGTAVPIPFDPDLRQMETAFLTPVEALQQVCPLLQTSEVCPYRGLNIFAEEHAEFFFGRDTYIDKLLNRLTRYPRFLPVFGPSGSGKSSVVQAGLIPRLRQGVIEDSHRWGVIVSRPADNPFKQLSDAGLSIDAQDLSEAMKSWLAQHQQYTRVMLIIDQFEELLSFCPIPIRQMFVTRLVQLLESSLPITVVVMMRDDFYNQFVGQEPLREWLERSGGPINVPQTLTPGEVTAIVQKPTEGVRLRFEDGLIEMIVKDVLETTPSPADSGRMARSTILPLLEFALTQLWEQRKNGQLVRAAYEKIGGVTGGLKRWADSVFYGLGDKEKQREAQHIFTGLVHIGDKDQNPPDSRRRLPLASLCRNNEEMEEMHQVVQQLASAKLLITTYDMEHGQEIVEIIHDALLWEWEQMRQWLRSDREFLTWRQELERRVQSWIETNEANPARREKEKLFRGSDLDAAWEWLKQRSADLSQNEQDFIQASRKLKLRRAVLTGVAGVVTGSIVVGGGIRVLLPLIPPYTDIFMYSQHKGPVYCVAWSPEASRIASGSADRTAQVYSSVGGKIYTYRGHTRTVDCLAWSPDGFRIASGSADQTAQVWPSDDQNPAKPFTYHQHRDAVLAIAWSPSGNFIASASYDTTVQIWNADTGAIMRKYTRHGGSVNTLAWSPDGKRIASAGGRQVTGSGDNTVHIWEAATGTTIFTYAGHSSHVVALAWSPDGNYMVSGGFDGTVQIWSTDRGQRKYTYRGHSKAEVNAVSWSPDGNLIASASVDKTAQIWKAFDGTTLCTYREHNNSVNSVAWTSLKGDRRIASAGDDAMVRVWQLK